MQKLCEVKVDTYLAADNPFDVVSRPMVCDRCGENGCFHRHGTYMRYVWDKLVKVARFVCARCRLTVSLLPEFVLPYRNRLMDAVDRYFTATDEARAGMADADQLQRYWRQWVGHMDRVQRDTGWPSVRPLALEPRAYWQQLGKAAASMEGAQRRLIGRYGFSLLRRYACHSVPRRFSC